MALNFPGPYQMRLFYTVSSVPHIMALNCDPDPEPTQGETFDNIFLNDRAGSNTLDLETALLDLLTLIKPLHNSTSCDYSHAELWKYEPLSFDATFWSTYDVSDTGGSGTGATLAGQDIFTFRTQEGGIFKLSLMETITVPGLPQLYTDLSVGRKALVDLFTSSSNVWLARDTSYPIAFMRMLPGRNEATFKKRFRP